MATYIILLSYTSKPRREARAIFVGYPIEMVDLKMIYHEINMLTDGNLVIVRNILKMSKHACLYLQNEHPCWCKILNHA